MAPTPRPSPVSRRPHRSRRARRAAGLLGAAALAVAALGGCSKAADKAGEKLAEKMIEDQTGNKVDVGKDGAVTVDGKDGTYSAGTGKLSKAWPTDIPVPDGVAVGFSGGGQGNAMMSGTSSRSPEDLLGALEKGLAGWTRDAEYSSSSGGTESQSVTFTKGDRTVAVVLTREGSTTTIAMTAEG